VAAMNFSLDADAKVGQDLTANGDQLNIKGAVGVILPQAVAI